jgi:hypothetical protein
MGNNSSISNEDSLDNAAPLDKPVQKEKQIHWSELYF